MDYLLQDRNVLLAIFALAGLLFGSFATALIYRLPRDINWVSKRSECTACNHKLNMLDLFPLISYIFSGGKCRYCKQKYGIGYLLIEFLMAAGFALVAYYFGYSTESIIFCLLFFSIVVLSLIDFQHYIIPDEVNLFILLLGLTYQIYSDADWQQMVLMPLMYISIALMLRWGMFAWKKKEALGLGDVKLFLACGMWLTAESLPIFLLFSGLSGIIIAVIWRIFSKGKIFPFGPALSASLFFCAAFPEIAHLLLINFNEMIYG